MYDELVTMECEDPVVLRVFVAEYYFLKGNFAKAAELFTALYKDPALPEVMQATVRNYLVIASRELRAREIEKLHFTITVAYGDGQKAVIDSEHIRDQIDLVGPLLEVLDFHAKKFHAAGG